jgi:hypothetical protein
MLGRLPWFALERRMRAFFFFVFFDMGHEVSGAADCFLVDHRRGARPAPSGDERSRCKGTWTLQMNDTTRSVLSEVLDGPRDPTITPIG